jgi:hypothetical protein
MQDGIWIKGKQVITGRWRYSRHEQRFYIIIDRKSVNKITGQMTEEIVTANDTPEWYNWKLQK